MKELSGRYARREAEIVRLNLLLPGAYAWISTVAYPAAGRGAPSAARITAFLALGALLLGPMFAIERPRLGRALGIHLFFALSVLTWLLLGSVISAERLDPVRSGLGGLSWVLFALGWGAIHRVSTSESDSPALLGPPLLPRSRLPTGAQVLIGVTIAGMLVPMLLAWRDAHSEHALLAHAVALLGALLIGSVGTQIALQRGRPRSFGSFRSRVNAALRPFAALLLLLSLGIIWLSLR